MAFEPDVRGPRNSPAAAIIAQLRAAGAEVLYPDPHVAEFRDADGPVYVSSTLEEPPGRADAVVAVTRHRAIDWDFVLNRASLLIDTIDVSHGRAVRPRQVLRLGAGWSADPVGASGAQEPATGTISA